MVKPLLTFVLISLAWSQSHGSFCRNLGRVAVSVAARVSLGPAKFILRSRFLPYVPPQSYGQKLEPVVPKMQSPSLVQNEFHQWTTEKGIQVGQFIGYGRDSRGKVFAEMMTPTGRLLIPNSEALKISFEPMSLEGPFAPNSSGRSELEGGKRDLAEWQMSQGEPAFIFNINDPTDMGYSFFAIAARPEYRAYGEQLGFFVFPTHSPPQVAFPWIPGIASRQNYSRSQGEFPYSIVPIEGMIERMSWYDMVLDRRLPVAGKSTTMWEDIQNHYWGAMVIHPRVAKVVSGIGILARTISKNTYEKILLFPELAKALGKEAKEIYEAGETIFHEATEEGLTDAFFTEAPRSEKLAQKVTENYDDLVGVGGQLKRFFGMDSVYGARSFYKSLQNKIQNHKSLTIREKAMALLQLKVIFEDLVNNRDLESVMLEEIRHSELPLLAYEMIDQVTGNP